MDGSILDFQPVYDSKTVTVSPFYCTGADIKPSVYVPMWWAMLPPGVRDVEWLFDFGYEDGLKWIVKNGPTGKRKKVVIPNTSVEYMGEWNTTVGRVVSLRVVYWTHSSWGSLYAYIAHWPSCACTWSCICRHSCPAARPRSSEPRRSC